MKQSLILIGSLVMAATLQAADGPVFSAPVLGYMFDEPGQTIRAISGVPGAASLGDTVTLPFAVTRAYVHSDARVAVGEPKEGGVALISWGAETHAAVLETQLNALVHAAFSRSGGRVALSDGEWIEVWSGTPALLHRWRADATVQAVAVNDAGEVAAATSAGRIVRFGLDDSQSLSASGAWAALAFAANGEDLIAVDATRDELVRLTREGGREGIALLPGAVQAVVASAEGYALATDDGLMLVSLAGEVTAVACNCQPRGLDALQGGLVAQVRGAALVLDADSGVARLTTLPTLYLGGAQ